MTRLPQRPARPRRCTRPCERAAGRLRTGGGPAARRPARRRRRRRRPATAASGTVTPRHAHRAFGDAYGAPRRGDHRRRRSAAALHDAPLRHAGGRPGRRRRPTSSTCPGVGDYRVEAATPRTRGQAGRRPADAPDRRHHRQPGLLRRCCSAWPAVALAGVLGRGAGAPPAAAAARGGRHRPRGQPRLPAVQRRDRHDGPGARRAHRRAHRGRPGRRRAQHPARPRRARPRRAAPQRAAGPPVRRRRLPRAAHAADHDPRVRRAEPAHRPPTRRSSSLAMAKVEAEATRMSSLVEDLLLLARLDAGRPLARDEVDLTRLAAGGRRRRPRRRPGPPLAARPARRAGRGARRRAAAAPGAHQPAQQRPPAHAAGHPVTVGVARGRPDERRAHRPRRRPRAAAGAGAAPRSSGSPAATPRAPGRPAAPASASRWCRRSPSAHGGRVSVDSGPGRTALRGPAARAPAGRALAHR